MRTRQPKAECDIVTVTVTGDELLLQCKGVRCLRVISPRQRASSLCSLLRYRICLNDVLGEGPLLCVKLCSP
eukprot:scaffold14590_cov20-Tisochrysis_lutea.AAC.2